MPLDSAPIVVDPDTKPDDITTILMDILSHIQFKFLGMLIIVFLFLSSDVFIGRILSRFNGAVDYKSSTSYGAVVTSIMLVIIMAGVDALIQQKII